MTNAVRLHVEAFGSGPLVALAHGFGGSAQFRGAARALADRASVLLYDARAERSASSPRSTRRTPSSTTCVA